MKLGELLCFTLLLALLLPAASAEVSFDAIALVERVVDGDTIVVTIIESRNPRVSPGSLERVRLADINAPELGTPEGESAKRYLERLLSRGVVVYLDLDDVKLRDKYGRLVAVVYFKVNDTCTLNVNYHLVVSGHAVIWDHFNEFDPRTWRECLEETPEPREPREKSLQDLAATVMVLIATVTIIVTMTLRRAGGLSR